MILKQVVNSHSSVSIDDGRSTLTRFHGDAPYLDDALEFLHIQPLCFYQLSQDVPAETEEAAAS